MVGVGQRFPGQVPGQVPSQVRIIQQDAHQLGHRHRGMCVVELNGSLFGKLLPIGVMPQKTPNKVCHRARDQKILLQKAQALPSRRVIVRVEHSRERLRLQGLAESADEISSTELFKIKIIRGSRGPKTKRVDCLAAVTNHRTIEWYSEQARWLVWNHLEVPVLQFKSHVQFDFYSLVSATDLPWVAIAEPVIRVLLLPSIGKRLSKHPVFVAKAIAGRRKLHGSHRVKETGRQSAQASVAQTSIRLLLDQFEPVDALVLNRLLYDGIEQKVGHVVDQRTANQEFHGKVIDALRILLLIGSLGLHPTMRQDVTHRVRERLETFP